MHGLTYEQARSRMKDFGLIADPSKTAANEHRLIEDNLLTPLQLIDTEASGSHEENQTTSSRSK
jgi:hypothetical protein